jgi:thiol-disulfide isomerase/thioredoxin
MEKAQSSLRRELPRQIYGKAHKKRETDMRFIPVRALRIGALVVITMGLLTGRSLANELLDLTQYQGSVVYLDFWASWCGPCKLSFPFMQRMQAVYGKDGLKVITVNLDTDAAAAQRFLTKVGGNLPVVYDPAGTLAERYDIGAMPTSILISKTGDIQFVHEGFHLDKVDEYQAHIQQLLSE